MSKRDPNIADRNQRALQVVCDYCGAATGLKCWFTRSPEARVTGLTRRHPHRQRIKASWKLTNAPNFKN